MPSPIISIPGIGTVIADYERGRLTPRTHVVGGRLFGSDDAARNTRMREMRESVEDEATERLGEPEFGWSWYDHNNCPIFL